MTASIAAGLAAKAGQTAATPCCPIVELRQYTLKPGQRDVMIELFDGELVDTQEATGISVIGQFRDLDNPDRFVWLRGFPDMLTRTKALSDFYTGPAWKAHRITANATMIDSDNVLLLRPTQSTGGFALARRPGDEAATGIVTATIYSFDAPVDAATLATFERDVEPALRATGAPTLATFVTEHSKNTFPALPVREGENVLVRFALFPDVASHDKHKEKLARSSPGLMQRLRARLKSDPQILRLAPTARSLLHG